MRGPIRFLRSRYGIAAILIVVVLVIVGAAKLAGTQRPVGVGPQLPGASVAATEPDDGLSSVQPSASALRIAGQPDVSTVATNFASAWLRHTGVTAEQWHDGLKDLSTPMLLSKLDGTDPASVPANRVTGAIQFDVRDERLVDAHVPLDSGSLILRLLVFENRWLVDGIDWVRG